MARRYRAAGRAHWGCADRRRAAGRARAIREALCGGYDPGWLAVAAAVAAGDPRWLVSFAAWRSASFLIVSGECL